MHRIHKRICLYTLMALGAAGSAPARATEPTTPVPMIDVDPSLGLDPTTPQTAALPGGVTPAYGQRSLSEGEWRFDFHGLLTAPLAVGFGNRALQLVLEHWEPLASPVGRVEAA
jgi:hypothetical protein